MALALSILWILSAFLVLWGASLMWRGWRPRARVEKRLTCPACRRPVASGLSCVACGFEGQSARDFLSPRDRRLMLCGWIPVAGGVGAGYGAEVVRGWFSYGGYSGDVPLSPMQGVAIGIVLFAIVLGVWSWRGDRSRGRRRCPKCWYDMSASKLVCPECGHDAKVVKQLYRPRRRRGGVVMGVALLVVAYGAWVTPRVMVGGPVGAVPSWVLIAGLPWWPDWMTVQSARKYREDWTLIGRVHSENLWSVDRWVLRARAKGIIDGSPGARALARAMHFLNVRDRDVGWMVHLAIVKGLSSANASDRDEVARLQPYFEVGIEAQRAIEPHMGSLVKALEDPAPGVRAKAAWYLSLQGGTAAGAFPKIIDSLRSAAHGHPLFPWALWNMAERSDAGRRVVLDASRDASAEVRQACAIALGTREVGAEGTQRLLEMLADPEYLIQQAAARSLCNAGQEPDVVIPAIFAWWRGVTDNRIRFPMELFQFGSKLNPHMPLLVDMINAETSKLEVLRQIEYLTILPDKPDFSALVPLLKAIEAGTDSNESAQATIVLQKISVLRP